MWAPMLAIFHFSVYFKKMLNLGYFGPLLIFYVDGIWIPNVEASIYWCTVSILDKSHTLEHEYELNAIEVSLYKYHSCLLRALFYNKRYGIKYSTKQSVGSFSFPFPFVHTWFFSSLLKRNGLYKYNYAKIM